jgi:uncharacterized membrane protein YgcG
MEEGGFLTRKQRIFQFLTCPSSSECAKLFSWYMDGLVILSILAFCCESVAQWSMTIRQRLGWFIVESIVSVHFVVDMLVKLLTQPTMTFYSLSWDALIDILSIVPWGYTMYWLVVDSAKNYTTLRLLRMLRFVRFFSITLGNFPRMSVFIKAVRRSGLAVLFLIIYVFGAGLFFSGCLFFAETAGCTLDRDTGIWMQRTSDGDQPMPCLLQNMFDAIWLCIVTMATVGYGDVVPQTGAGKVIAGLVMLTSMVFIPLPASIFGANLTELYLEARLVHRLEKIKARHSPNNGEDHGKDHGKGILYSAGGGGDGDGGGGDGGGGGGDIVGTSSLTGPMSLHETSNLLSLMEALEGATEHISRDIIDANSRLLDVQRNQRNVERSLMARHSPETNHHHLLDVKSMFLKKE